MKKIEFINLEMAIDHAKCFGGLIFVNKDETKIIWYDVKYYTMSTILKDSPGSGTIGTWSYIESLKPVTT